MWIAKENISYKDYGYLSDKEYFKYQTILLDTCSVFIIGVWILTIISGYLGICWIALIVLTFPTLICWAIYIKEYIKYNKNLKSTIAIRQQNKKSK